MSPPAQHAAAMRHCCSSEAGVDDSAVELTEVDHLKHQTRTLVTGLDDVGTGHFDSQSSLSGEGSPHIISAEPAAAYPPPLTLGNRGRRHRFQGWRFGVAFSACATISVFLLNLVLLIVGVSTLTFQDGIGTVYEGSCDVVNYSAIAVHIAINALATLLLGASNYTMQCLSAPTRKEVNQAHAKGDFVDIGVASVRNIFGRIALHRRFLWGILALSSIPIHLLYNSVAFKALGANYYRLAVAKEDFLHGAPYSGRNLQLYQDFIGSTNNLTATMLNDVAIFQNFFRENTSPFNATAVQLLSPSECVDAYGTAFVSGRSDLLLITSGENTRNDTSLQLWGVAGVTSNQLFQYDWMCLSPEDMLRIDGIQPGPGNCYIPTLKIDPNEWQVAGHHIDYCLSKLAPAYCRLQFSLQIFVAVLVCNILKASVMLWTLFRIKEATLVTIGDAISSFLTHPDPSTAGRCLIGRAQVARQFAHPPAQPRQPEPAMASDTKFTATRPRRFAAAVSPRRWAVTMAFCVLTLTISGGLLDLAAKSERWIAELNPFKVGFGAIDINSLILIGLSSVGARGLVENVLVANLPQAICSFIYLAYNGLFTSMLLASEWSRYYIKPKPLRVSTPHGIQRSSYYLHLPLKYSLPLLIASTALHYLISESILLVRINVWDDLQPLSHLDSTQIGFSCVPLLLVILLGTGMLAVVIGTSFRRFSSIMPVAGSCSRAISAACHRPESDPDAPYLPVAWGATTGGAAPALTGEVWNGPPWARMSHEVAKQEEEEDPNAVGHCCFTNHEVRRLVPGRYYE